MTELRTAKRDTRSTPKLRVEEGESNLSLLCTLVSCQCLPFTDPDLKPNDKEAY